MLCNGDNLILGGPGVTPLLEEGLSRNLEGVLKDFHPGACPKMASVRRRLLKKPLLLLKQFKAICGAREGQPFLSSTVGD